MPRHSTSSHTVTLADLADSERMLVERYHSRRSGWKRFARDFRARREPLLASLDTFPKAVLVAGCQRSGTTMLTRILAGAKGFRRFQLTHDDELDAALVLAGAVHLPPAIRYCFQTTYLNERFGEYAGLSPDQRLIWVVRNPYSVVFSMVYNWRRYALEELYASCGDDPERARRMPMSWWRRFDTRAWVERAARAYAGKAAQVFHIRELLGPERMLVVDYDALVRDPAEWLRRAFEFVGEPFDPAYGAAIRRDSIGKSRRLSDEEREVVDRFATPVHRRTLELVDAPVPDR